MTMRRALRPAAVLRADWASATAGSATHRATHLLLVDQLRRPCQLKQPQREIEAEIDGLKSRRSGYWMQPFLVPKT
jgi:hypothetical protein